MGTDNDLNLDKVLCISHTFHLFLGAARSALFPFLTIYFRLLGLSATQTGLLLGAKAFMTFTCAPAWAACAKRFNKKKIVLIFSIFMLLASNLFLCLVPPVTDKAPLRFCEKDKVNLHVNNSGSNPLFSELKNVSTPGPAIGNVVANDLSTKIALILSSTKKAPEKTTKSLIPSSTTTTLTTTNTTPTKTTTTASTTPQPTTTTDNNQHDKEIDSGSQKSHPNGNQNVETSTDDGQEEKPSSEKKQKENFSQEDLELLEQLGISADDLKDLSLTDLNSLIDEITKKESRSKRNILQKVKTKWDELSNRFEIAEYQTFVIVLMVMILGELFSAPYEKLADDCWFEYLDLLDSLERFGGQNVWRTIGYVLIPTIVTAIIDHTQCLLPLGLHHFYIHFFAFALLMLVVFVSGLCYPVSQNKQTPKRSRMTKGFKVLCGDIHAFAMTFTMIVLGAGTAVMSNFLMWKLQDLASSEMVMGVAIAVSAASEFVLQLVGRGLVKKLTPTGAVCLGLLLLVGRLVFYSFLWNPWLVLAGEVLNGLTVTLIWIAIRTYPDFRINPFVMDRSASSVITGLYVGVGFAGGSMVSGLVYDKLGYALLFQGTAGLVFLWGVIFLILQKAVKKTEKVRYAKLLQDENADDSDESVIYEEDWLEVAMKRNR